jgi:tetratricopeptide (TPR) repeat protein
MRLRPVWLLCWCTCLGCHSLALPDDADPEQAEQLWRQGQAAMSAGDADRAIGFYERSLAADPLATRSHLSLAAAYLEKGQDEPACAQLDLYLQAHPEHHQVRAHHAELMMRLGRAPEARDEFARFIAYAQERDDTIRQQIHCQSRLMELAEAGEDDYALHLHRGIGLYLLARERSRLPAADDHLPVEQLLCQAADDLLVSCRLKPDEARPCWYLYCAWSALGQKQAAQRWLTRAREAAPFGSLTAAEQRGLELARRQTKD